jgi:ABC-type lipoprotein export system ATPase subunit
VILVAEALVRLYGGEEVVRGASLSLAPAGSVSLVGPSGSGKTTLLQMIGLLDRPDGGRVLLDGDDLWALDGARRAQHRLASFGFVFQQHNLLGHLSARENVALPAWRLGGHRQRSLDAADALLDRFGLGRRKDAPAGALSTGEAQRAAIARALINGPKVVLADEPTGSLDSRSSAAVLDALDEVCKAGAALLVVTHDAAVARRAGRRVEMRDGRVEDAAAITL